LGQFIKILDFITKEKNLAGSISNGGGSGSGSGSDISRNQHEKNEMNARTVGIILTTWAVLENVPKEVSTKFFFMRLVEGLLPSVSNNNGSHGMEGKINVSVRLSIRRIRLLLMYTPPGSFSVLNYFCHFMTSDKICAEYQHSELPNSLSESSSDSAPGVVSPFSQILRVACAHGNRAIESDDVRTATDILRMVLYAIISKCNSMSYDDKKQRSESSVESYISVLLLQSVSMNAFDVCNYKFRRQAESFNGGEVSFEVGNDDPDTEIDLITAMEERSSFVINHILDAKDEFKRLPSEMFKLLLLLYFSNNNCSEIDGLPESIRTRLNKYKIVAMMMLPTLCESCSPTSLFMDDGLTSNGVLETFSLIISMISKKLQDDSDSFDSGHDSEETELSITSIVLSLLVAMLELGSGKRTEREEKELTAMLPPLESLTILTDTSFQNPTSTSVEEIERSQRSILKSEIAEMSSHAMALILSRSVPDKNSEDNLSVENMTASDFIMKTVNDSDTMLSSDQPPLRARALVQLRQIARGSLEELCKSYAKKEITPTPLIMELNNDDVQELDLGAPDHLVKAMLRVCLKALADIESYVYLASIQTIVAIADISPSCSMPFLVEAVTSGQVQLSSCASSQETMYLNSAQRIKVSEALIFTIRRRAEAIRNYSDLIMNSILYGKRSNKAISNEIGLATSTNIQGKTEIYFRGNDSKREGEFDEYAPPTDNMEEREVRVNTGGPVFDSEENDVVRAACISIATELVSTMHPSAVEPFCPTLTKFGINALRLDHSRIVRRAAALLCREIYSCALREIGNDSGQAKEASVRFTIALLQSGEELLSATLSRCISGDDVDVSSGDGDIVSSVKGKNRLFDPATVARCKEALHLRNTLSEDGVMDAIQIYLKSQGWDRNQPLSRLIARELNNQSKPSVMLDLAF